MKIRNRFGLLLAFIMTIVSIPVGFSAWSTISPISSSEVITIPTSDKQVAYYDSNYFPTIESAVASANETGSSKNVYVIPGTNPTITQSFDINSNVTLIMPYSGETYNSGKNTTASSPNSTDFEAATYVKNIIKISKGVNINVKGNFYVGGVVSCGWGNSTTVFSYVGGDHVKVVLEENVTINVTGSLTSYGRIIKDNINDSSCKINIIGGNLLQPAIIRDWPGASSAIKRVNNNTMPFCNYEIPYITVPMYFSKSGKFIGEIRMEEITTRIVNLNVINSSNDSLVKVNDSSVIRFEYKNIDANQKIMTAASNRSTIIQMISGSAEIGYISLNVYITVSTNKFPIVIPSTFSLIIGDGDNAAQGTCNYSACFSPGTSIVIKEKSTLNLDSSKNTSGSNTSFAMFEDAVIENHGTLNVGGPCAFKVISKSNNAKLNVSDSVSDVSTSYKYLVNGTETTLTSENNFLRGDVIEDSTVTDDKRLETGAYESVQDGNDPNIYYWNRIFKLTLSSYESSPGLSSDGTAKVEFVPSAASDSGGYRFYDWSVSGEGVLLGETAPDAQNNGVTSLQNIETNIIYFYAKANENTGSKAGDFASIYATITVTAKKSQNDEGGLSNTVTFERRGKEGSDSGGGGCVIPGTMITLADGSQKAVENILPGDELLVINHETGQYDVSPVIFNDSEPLGMYDVTYLRFSDGSEVGISYEHGFFDRTLNKYVYITNSNGEQYIGHEFYTENGYVTLDEVETVQEETRLYSPVTAWHLNYFTNGVLSMPGGIEGLFNIFEYEQDSLKYDEFLMQQDIDTYGLFTYDDFKDYCSYEFYSAFPAPYLKVSIGKGYITKEEIIRLIKRYSKLV